MMEAKDTVMDVKQDYELRGEKFKEITSRQENLMFLEDYKTFKVEHEISEYLKEKQAEISFKAGIKEVVDWLGDIEFVQELRGLDEYDEPYCQVFQVDPKYIVQVAKEKGELAYYYIKKKILYKEWQAKLKEWGL